MLKIKIEKVSEMFKKFLKTVLPHGVQCCDSRWYILVAHNSYINQATITLVVLWAELDSVFQLGACQVRSLITHYCTYDSSECKYRRYSHNLNTTGMPSFSLELHKSLQVPNQIERA